MIITELHRGKWSIKTGELDHSFIFQSGSASGLLSVKLGTTVFSMEPEHLDVGLIELAEIYRQMALRALPYDESNFEHLTLFRGIERTLATLGISVHLQEYGDEEEEFKAKSSPACFIDGRFKQEFEHDGFHYILSMRKYHHRYGGMIKIEKYAQRGESRTIIERGLSNPTRTHLGPIDPGLIVEKIKQGESLCSMSFG